LRPVGETEFAEAQARAAPLSGPRLGAIVGCADLTLGDAVDELLEAHATAGRGLFRGIRQVVAFDLLNGGAEHDELTGGAGADTLVGGAGSDKFIFLATGDSTAAATDIIRDFHHADHDVIDLSAIDANTLVDGDQAFLAPVQTASFHNVAGELIEFRQGGQVVVSGDVNGDGISDFMFHVSGGNLLVAADLVL
jgi:hypothetical protein